MTVVFNDVNSGEQIACLQASLANGWSTRQPGVLWGTSMFALAAVALAWLHTAWNYSRLDPLTLTEGDRGVPGPTEVELVAGGLVTGNSSPAQWRVVDIVFLFQSMAACGLMDIDYPSVFAAFVLNFRWSLGLFTTPSVQRSINSARAKTGGSMSRWVVPCIFTPPGDQQLMTCPRRSSTVRPIPRSLSSTRRQRTTLPSAAPPAPAPPHSSPPSSAPSTTRSPTCSPFPLHPRVSPAVSRPAQR